jgi:hypothetical protein
MAFTQRIVEFKISDTAFTQDAEGTANIHFQKFINSVTALTDGTGMPISRRVMPKMSNVELVNVDKDSIDIFNQLNDAGQNITVKITIGAENGDVTYSGTVKITGEYSFDVIAGRISGFELECVDNTGFVQI